MKIYLTALLLALTHIVLGQNKIESARQAQQELNKEYASEGSPLVAKDKANFTGLPFFDIDTTWVVDAILEITPNEPPFKMPTTTSRMANYRKYGVLSFERDGQAYELFVYQNIDLMKTEGYEDYLFLPFKDYTNGESTYGGGRYINLRIPEGNRITLDFNTCYNPYCAYNQKYSCPIVPSENMLEIAVNAGVKKHD